MTKPDKRQQKEARPPKTTEGQPKRRRGRPEKFYRIDDTPLNVARSFFRIPSDKFTKPEK